MRPIRRPLSPAIAVVVALLSACGAPARSGGAPPADAVVLTVTGARTSADGRSCALDIALRSTMARDAGNIQVAYTARTDGHGIQSEYVILGDLAAGEEKAGQLYLTGAPCAAIQTMKLTRAVCALLPASEPPESCAGAVTLDGGGVVTLHD